MMDSDFEDDDTELKLNPQLELQSQSAKEEAQAAKDLQSLVETLRLVLMDRAFEPSPPVLTAVALVDASCRGTGPFYSCATWNSCKSHRQSFEGRSFRDMRALAKSCLSDLQ